MKNNKSLGQHWLKDRFILDAIADLAVSKDSSSANNQDKPELVLEIGPGLGTLTSSLLKRFHRVLAVEYDARLAHNLPNSFPGKNLEVIHADILQFDLDTLPTPYAVAGNIPYYITSPIISKLLTAKLRPERIVLLIQKEVAERILAEPGNHTYLSLFVQNYAVAEPGFLVPKEYFTPPPKVDSAVIVLTPKAPTVQPPVLQFIKQGFRNPRKKLSKNLPYNKDAIERAFASLSISQNARPADLDLPTWQNLHDFLAKNKQ